MTARKMVRVIRMKKKKKKRKKNNSKKRWRRRKEKYNAGRPETKGRTVSLKKPQKPRHLSAWMERQRKVKCFSEKLVALIAAN